MMGKERLNSFMMEVLSYRNQWTGFSATRTTLYIIIILFLDYYIFQCLIIILNGFIKQPVIKQSPTFLSFSFLIDCCMSAFYFFIKAFVNFRKLLRYYQQAFILYKNGENLKVLKEILR